MSISIPDFWKLVIESHLLSAQQCQQLGANFGHVKGAAGSGSSRTLAEWLIAEGAISRFQASVLLSGRAGPFYYGDYKVFERVDKGRFQGNFRAVHVATGQPVQLQFLTGAVAQDPQSWPTLAAVVQHRFLHPHPHVQRYFDLVDAGAFKFMVAEDLVGETLQQRVQTAGRMAPADAVVLVRELAGALAHLHQLSFLHGAVSPQEIWVTDQETVRLLHDPSRSVAPLAAYANEPPEEFARRADYAAPELANPQANPDTLSDIYALGCVFYQTLTGSPPFAGGTAYEKMQRHAVEAIQPLGPLGVPQAVEQIVMYLMAKNPAVRFPQAAIVAEQLVPFCDPARLYARPHADPPTMGAYEAQMRQRWASGLPLVPQASSPAATSTGSTSSGTIPSGVAVPTSKSEAAGGSKPPSSVASGAASNKSRPRSSEGSGELKSGSKKERDKGSSGAPKSAAPRTQGAGTTSSATTPRPAPAPQPTAATAAAAAAVVSGLPSSSGSAVDRMRETQGSGQKNTWILVGSLGAVAIVLVVGILMFAGGGKKPSDSAGPEVAQNDPPDIDPNLTKTSTTPPKISTPTNPGPDKKGPSTSTGSPTTNSKTGGSGATSTSTGGKPGEKPGTTSGKPTSNDPEKTSEKPAAAFEQVVVPDDGASLWASPTSGPPVELDFVPLDSHFILHMRPAELLDSDEGPKFLQALGPALKTMLSQWEEAAGVALADVEQLLFTLHDNGDDWPRAAFVVRLKQPVTEAELVAKWGNPAPQAVKNSKIYQGAGWSYFVPAKPLGVFVMGTPDDIKQIAEVNGAPPPLRRELGVLRRLTDSDRHLSILATPNFLMTNLLRDGRTYYFGEAKRLREPLDWFLRDEVQAMLWSVHFGGDTYLEMRMIGTQGKDRFTLAKEVRDRLSQVPDLLFEYIATLGSNPYWERVRLRYPGMINFLHGKTRIGADVDTAALNCRLPRAAAHNLAFGSEMVLVSTPGAPAAAVASTGGGPAKPSAASLSFEDILNKHVTSMSFEAQSLEFAIQDIAKDVNETLKGLPFEFKIKIMGEDLQLDGITRNQTVRDFMQKDKTVGEILTAMVRKANAPNVPDPSMPEQKLLWVIDKDPDNPAKPIVLVTTRAAAEKRKYTLPAQFKPK